MAHLIWLDSCDSTSQVVLLGTTVTDDHHLAQESLVLFKCYHHTGSGFHGGYLVAYVSDLEVGSLVCFHGEITIEIGSGSILGTQYANRCADDRLTCSIFHMTFDGYLLCKGAHG